MSKLITLEGTDAAGKGTQLELIKKYLKDKNISFQFFHFPMYGHNKFSEMIARFLRGEFGSIEEVSPYFVANLYAMDRFMFLPELEKAMKENDIILLDRYVFSNIAYQGAKYKLGDEDNHKIAAWIYRFEFYFLGLPKPDLNIFFDIPMEVIKKRLESAREGSDRDYLNGQKDIHEADLNFQSLVRANYLFYMSGSTTGEINNKIIQGTIDKGNNEFTVFDPDTLFKQYKKYIDDIL